MQNQQSRKSCRRISKSSASMTYVRKLCSCMPLLIGDELTDHIIVYIVRSCLVFNQLKVERVVTYGNMQLQCY